MVGKRIPAAVLGATGTVGQYFVKLLAQHPWFELRELVASERSAGKSYREACHWQLGDTMPEEAAPLGVLPLGADLAASLVFSALPSDVAGGVETYYASRGHYVFSNASNHRMDPLVPLLVPEVNPEHAELVHAQQAAHGWSGFIVTNPNCASAVIVMALRPLHTRFTLRKAVVTTLQAISGAGYPGLPSLDILDNAIPYIGGEERKLETEPLKMLGKYTGTAIAPAEFIISAHCNRVATRDGHLECVSVELGAQAGVAELEQALREFSAAPQHMHLPTAPQPPIVVRSEPDRPQTRLDRDVGAGMAVTVGRLRPCPILTHKFVVLGSNTMRGAAGGSVLNAELMLAQGLVR